MQKDPIEFERKVIRTDSCHLWVGATQGNGYGSVGGSGTAEGAHRVSWRFSKGPIPAGMNVLHKCRNRHCVNPDHLYLGTQRENLRDAIREGTLRPPKRKTHCLRGHAYSEQPNPFGSDGYHACWVCATEKRHATAKATV
jgi:hypothetical protein